MSKLSFDLAVADVETAKSERENLQFLVLDIGGEDYAAVRPSGGTYAMITQLVPDIKALLADPETRDAGAGAVIAFLDEVFKQADVRAALIASGDYVPDDEDEDLDEVGEQLARSHARLIGRFVDRNDDLGIETLTAVMVGLSEHWSGKPTSQPRDYLPGRKTTGARSTGTRSRKASTTRASGAKARRAS